MFFILWIQELLHIFIESLRIYRPPPESRQIVPIRLHKLEGCVVDIHSGPCPCISYTERALITACEITASGVVLYRESIRVRLSGWHKFSDGHTNQSSFAFVTRNTPLPEPSMHDGTIRFQCIDGRWVTIYSPRNGSRDRPLPLDIPLLSQPYGKSIGELMRYRRSGAQLRGHHGNQKLA